MKRPNHERRRRQLRWKAVRELIKASLTEESYDCTYCKLPILKERITLDHIVPRSRGGKSYSYSNLALCCYACNQLKRDMLVEEFLLIREERAS